MTRAWARLKTHWVRHVLAALQVAVGVAAVTAVVIDVVPVLRSAGEDRGASIYSVFHGGQTQTGGFYSTAFQLSDVELLSREADTVVAVSIFDHQGTALVRSGGDLFVVSGMAKVSPDLADVTDVRLVQGRFFTGDDAKPTEPGVAVVSKGLAEALFAGQDPVGEVINLRPNHELSRILGWSSPVTAPTDGMPGLDLRIVGVFDYPEGIPGYMGLFAGTPRTELLIPATGRFWPSMLNVVFRSSESGDGAEATAPIVPEQDEEYTHIYFRAAAGMELDAVAEVEALLAPRLAERVSDRTDFGDGRTAALMIQAADAGGAARWAELQGAMVIGAMGVAALIVSGFSIFTTFLAGVAERVRAIGLARSLGATRLRILREIVGEAVLLAAIGGVAGVLLAIPARAFVLEDMLGLYGPSAGLVDAVIAGAIGVLLAVGIGALASLYPGWTVARLLPAEAFHDE